MHLIPTGFLLIAASAVRGGVIQKAVHSADAVYNWDVTQWQAGLSHGNPAAPITSWYTFTVSGSGIGIPGSDNYVPAFSARCEGDGAGRPLASEYKECATDPNITEAGSSVSARIVPQEAFAQAHIAINLVFSTAGGPKNWTAIAVTDWARERPPYDFTVDASEAF
ncbi:hypothetical protein F4808DRAFT_455362 [Astrocystis sublimbata]|nr:hypothetical protein F4808DRAFT_455362 [Astrocystis sublimbata]